MNVRLALFTCLISAMAAIQPATADRLDRRFIGKWHAPGQAEACKLGGLGIRADAFKGCQIITASTPEINKYNDGGITQYIAAQCIVEAGSETTFYWLHLNKTTAASYGRVGGGGENLLEKCPS